jgi:PAS domain-containing protein
MPVTFDAVTRNDGDIFVVHFRPVAGWPLIIALGASRGEVMALWWRMVLVATPFVLIVIAGIAAINELLIRELKNRQNSEVRFRDFAESTSDWLWEQGPDLRFTYV